MKKKMCVVVLGGSDDDWNRRSHLLNFIVTKKKLHCVPGGESVLCYLLVDKTFEQKLFGGPR